MEKQSEHNTFFIDSMKTDPIKMVTIFFQNKLYLTSNISLRFAPAILHIKKEEHKQIILTLTMKDDSLTNTILNCFANNIQDILHPITATLITKTNKKGILVNTSIIDYFDTSISLCGGTYVKKPKILEITTEKQKIRQIIKQREKKKPSLKRFRMLIQENKIYE